MKIPFTDLEIQAVPEGNEIFGFSTARVQYFFGIAVVTWVTMPAEFQTAILSALGFTPDRMLLISAGMWIISTLAARRTKVASTSGELEIGVDSSFEEDPK